jgi:hypothetical protein
MKTLLLAVVAVLVPGCIVVRERDFVDHRGGRTIIDDDYEHRHHEPVGRVVEVERTHYHSDSCGHYLYNGRWYHSHGHVHGAGCGHVHTDGIWVMAGAVAIKVGHVHSHDCGHYHSNGTWYYMHKHVHGPGCGHAYKGGVWVGVKW